MKKENLLIVAIIIFLIGCATKKVNFIITEDGKKQYKNEEGIFVKDNWIELNGDKYYFDKNGYLVTNDWVQEEYFVDSDGKMKKDFWYNDGKSDDYYYLGNDGKFVRDDIVDIGDKSYAFDKNGLWIKNKIFNSPKDKEKTLLADKNGIIVKNEGEYEVNDKKYYVDTLGKIVCQSWEKVDGKDAYYNESGERVYNGFALTEESILSTNSEMQKWYFLDENGDIVKNDYIDYGGENYCADENGILLANQWKEYNGKKYYYGSDCNLLKNQIVDNYYYVDETGAMVTNKEITIEGEIYTFGNDGRGNVKQKPKQSNNNWIIRNYTNTNEKYVTNKTYFKGLFGSDATIKSISGFNLYSQVFVEKNGIGFKVFSKKYEPYSFTGKSVDISISIDGTWLMENEKVEWNELDYIKLNYNQRKQFLGYCENGSKATIIIREYSYDKTYIYSFMINDLYGLYDLYSTL